MEHRQRLNSNSLAMQKSFLRKNPLPSNPHRHKLQIPRNLPIQRQNRQRMGLQLNNSKKRKSPKKRHVPQKRKTRMLHPTQNRSPKKPNKRTKIRRLNPSNKKRRTRNQSQRKILLTKRRKLPLELQRPTSRTMGPIRKTLRRLLPHARPPNTPLDRTRRLGIRKTRKPTSQPPILRKKRQKIQKPRLHAMHSPNPINSQHNRRNNPRNQNIKNPGKSRKSPRQRKSLHDAKTAKSRLHVRRTK